MLTPRIPVILPSLSASEIRVEQHGNDAAASRHEGFAAELDRGERRMAYECAENAADDRGTAEFLRGIVADEKVHAPEYGAAGNGEQLVERGLSEGRIGLARYVKEAADESAGNEGRDQRDEDARDALEQQVEGRGVACPYPGVQGLSSPMAAASGDDEASSLCGLAACA